MLHRTIPFFTSSSLDGGISQTISDLNTDQTYTFSFYYRIAVMIPDSPNFPVTLEAVLGNEVIFTLPITSRTQLSPTYILATKTGIRPQSSTTALIIRARAEGNLSRTTVLYVDDVSLAQEEPSTTVACSPAAPTIT
jgi:hypothetical protein